jgi:hypothetical protein
MNTLNQPTPALAPTPRTQKQLLPINSHTLPGDVVYADLARTLERELSAAKAECERLKFALVEWEAKERGWSKAVEKDAAELTRLRAQLAAIEEDGTQEHNAAVSLRLKLVTALDRADNAEADNAKWQKLLLMSRDDREIDLISEIEEQARLLGMSGEREADLLGKLGRLENELAAIKGTP